MYNGVPIIEDATEREKLFDLKAKCEHLVERIANRRAKQQYDRTTKRLRLKLERMRVSLQNFRTKWHHVEAKKIFDFESARLKEHFARVKAVARWFRHNSAKEYADRSACDVCGQN